jgi:hypothetical protein
VALRSHADCRTLLGALWRETSEDPLSAPAQLLLWALVGMFDPERQDMAWPSNKALMEATGLTKSALGRGLQDLRDRKVVRCSEDKELGRVIFLTWVPNNGNIPKNGDVPNNGNTPSQKWDSRARLSKKGRSSEGENACAGEDNFQKKSSSAEGDGLPPTVAATSPARWDGGAVNDGSEVDELGKRAADWGRLFAELMGIQNRQLVWGQPSLPPRLARAFEDLQRIMRAERWWPSRAQMEAVRWRYALELKWCPDRCVGGHTKTTDVDRFVREFVTIVRECETHYQWSKGETGAPLFTQAKVRPWLDDKPEGWTRDQVEEALSLKLIPVTEARRLNDLLDTLTTSTT